MHKACLSEQRDQLMELFRVSDNETLAQIEVAEDGLATWTKPGPGMEQGWTNLVLAMTTFEFRIQRFSSSHSLGFID